MCAVLCAPPLEDLCTNSGEGEGCTGLGEARPSGWVMLEGRKPMGIGPGGGPCGVVGSAGTDGAEIKEFI